MEMIDLPLLTKTKKKIFRAVSTPRRLNPLSVQVGLYSCRLNPLFLLTFHTTFAYNLRDWIQLLRQLDAEHIDTCLHFADTSFQRRSRVCQHRHGGRSAPEPAGDT